MMDWIDKWTDERTDKVAAICSPVGEHKDLYSTTLTTFLQYGKEHHSINNLNILLGYEN